MNLIQQEKIRMRELAAELTRLQIDRQRAIDYINHDFSEQFYQLRSEQNQINLARLERARKAARRKS